MTSVRAGGLKERKQGVDPITIFDVPRLSLSGNTKGAVVVQWNEVCSFIYIC